MDVAVVGAGPVGLMLAAELRLGGAEVVVLDRRATPDERPRANGLGGRIVEQLDHRGLLDRFRAEAAFAGPVPGFPFGPVPLDFAGLDTPMRGLMLQQPRMEALLAARATELGAELRRGHELVDLDTVRGPDGSYRLDGAVRRRLRRRAQPRPRAGRHRVPRHDRRRAAAARALPGRPAPSSRRWPASSAAGTAGPAAGCW